MCLNTLLIVCFSIPSHFSVLFFYPVISRPDFNFTCPSSWFEGAVENLRCVIPRAPVSPKPGGLCDIYVDSVVFKLTKADGTKSTACMVPNFDTTCDGRLNADGCGCRDTSGGNIVIDYNVTAIRASHEGAHWECVPQCFNASGTILSPPNTPECSQTQFGEYI